MTSDAPPAAPRILARRHVFLIPVLASFLLSAVSVGPHCHWQDSGLYLSSIKDMTVLYPHGFMLYLLLCKAWTLTVGSFFDFTLAVHLFSSLCAALAAGTLALAAEKITADRSSSVVAAVLAAAGYTWWFSGLYAKGYALYFLIIALLLWRMACRDPHSVIPLLGLAWAAHPSATLLGPAALIYLWFQRRAMRLPRLLLAAAASLVAAFGPSLLLPLLAAKESPYSMGNPRDFAGVWHYLTGSRFTSAPGVWGFSANRWGRIARFAAEEFLLVGSILVAAGLRELGKDRRRELLLLIPWALPFLTVLPMFKIEGQDDLWLVVVWMPLWIVAAAGLSKLKTLRPWVPAAALAGGLACALAMNARDLHLRNETLPESMGRAFLQNLDRNAILVVNSDDAIGLCRYLQSVRGFRTDVRIIQLPYIVPDQENRWYLEAMARTWPGFGIPDFAPVLPYLDRYTNTAVSQAAIAHGQKAGGPPIYFDTEPATSLLPPGSVIPSGFLWKWSDAERQTPDPRAWNFPVTMEQVSGRFGRPRGQTIFYSSTDVFVRPEAYERRLLYFLAVAQRNLGHLIQRGGGPQAFAQSAPVYESILKWAPEFRSDPGVLYPLALDYFMLDRLAESNNLFEEVLRQNPFPTEKAGALFYLGELRRMQRRNEEAADFYRKALDAAPADSPLRPELQKRLAPQ